MGLFKIEGLFYQNKQFRRFTAENSPRNGTKTPDIIERSVQSVIPNGWWAAISLNFIVNFT
jgi:hypothetical protein